MSEMGRDEWLEVVGVAAERGDEEQVQHVENRVVAFLTAFSPSA